MDDGSTDDTWFYIDQALDALPRPDQDHPFSGQPRKKAALYAGFKAARGEIMVTVDSEQRH